MTHENGTVVGVLHLRFGIPAETLKEKRSVVQPVLARIRGKFNCAAAEVGELDDAMHATLAVSIVSNDARHADTMLQSIARYVEGERFEAELLTFRTELVHL